MGKFTLEPEHTSKFEAPHVAVGASNTVALNVPLPAFVQPEPLLTVVKLTVPLTVINTGTLNTDGDGLPELPSVSDA